VVTTACPQDDNPLSYDRLDGEWLVWYQVAHRFERKVPSPDRADIRHSIILELAKARRRDGQPIPILRAYRIASLTIALYWRKEKRKPTILSLDHQVNIGDGDTAELMSTIADDKAMDISAWIDAKTWLLGCPMRLVQIAKQSQEKVEATKKALEKLRDTNLKTATFQQKAELIARLGIKLYPSEDLTYMRMYCGLNITEPQKVSCHKTSIASPKL